MKLTKVHVEDKWISTYYGYGSVYLRPELVKSIAEVKAKADDYTAGKIIEYKRVCPQIEVVATKILYEGGYVFVAEPADKVHELCRAVEFSGGWIGGQKYEICKPNITPIKPAKAKPGQPSPEKPKPARTKAKPTQKRAVKREAK